MLSRRSKLTWESSLESCESESHMVSHSVMWCYVVLLTGVCGKLAVDSNSAWSIPCRNSAGLSEVVHTFYITNKKLSPLLPTSVL